MKEDIKNSIKAKMYDFTYTPFMSSVIISWIILNHKYLLIYFGNSKLDEKLVMLNDYNTSIVIYKTEIPYSMNILLPILFGLFYVFVYPQISKFFYEYTLNRTKELKKIKQEIEDETPITQEEAQKIREDISRLEDEKDEVLKKLSNKDDEYKTKLENELQPLQDQIESYIATQKESDEQKQELKDQNEKLQSQLDQSNEFLMSKNDEYAELEKKVANLDKQLKSVGVVNATAVVGGIQVESSVDTNNKADTDFAKIVRYLYDSYNLTDEENLINSLNKEKGVAKLVARDVIYKLISKKVLLKDNNNYIHITPEGTSELIKTINAWDKNE